MMESTNRGPHILAATWVQCAIALLLVGARMYTRIHLIHNVGLDDWIILLALVSSMRLIMSVVRIEDSKSGRFWGFFAPASSQPQSHTESEDTLKP